MLDQTVLVQDVVAPSCDLEMFVNVTGNVGLYRWYLVTSEVYLSLTKHGKAGITAYDCFWIGEIDETQSIFGNKGGGAGAT